MREVEGVGFHSMTDAEPLGNPSLFGTYKKLMKPQFSVQLQGHAYHRIEDPYTTESPFSGHCCHVWAERHQHSSRFKFLSSSSSKELWRLFTVASTTAALTVVGLLFTHRIGGR